MNRDADQLTVLVWGGAGRCQAVARELRAAGCEVESVCTAVDLLQWLLRREFDAVLAVEPAAGAARLPACARLFQPWLAWLEADAAASPAGGLGRRLRDAVRRQRRAAPAGDPRGLARLLLFLEKLRGFMPTLLEHHDSFPLLACLQHGLAGVLGVPVSALLEIRPGHPVLRVQAREAVRQEFLGAVVAEMLAAYRALEPRADAARAGVEYGGQPAAADGPGEAASLLVMPVVVGQELQGLLGFAAAVPGAFDPGEASHAAHVVNHLQRLFPDLAHMQSLAARDELTGLFNRRSFRNELQRAWLLSRRHHYTIGLLTMDLDKFKALNDNYGHMVGDAVLKEFAGILSGAARRTDILARHGGDEFAVLLANANAAQTEAFAQRVLAAVAGHVFCADRFPLHLGVSIGMAASDAGRLEDESGLLALADRGLYLAKDRGGGVAVSAAEETPVAAAAPGAPAAAAKPGPAGRILVIDDEPAITALLQRMLPRHGFEVQVEHHPARALERVGAAPEETDVALVDMRMPEMNGIELIRRLQNVSPDLVCIILTGFASMESTIEALRAGAYDFMQKPMNLEELKFGLQRAVEHRRLRRQLADYRRRLEDDVAARTRSLQETSSALEQSYMATLEALGAALKMHEADASEHDWRVAEFAVILARRLGLEEDHVAEIRRAALLHDLGKIGIPDAILQKREALSAAEMDLMRRHPAIGWRIVRNVPFLQDEAEMIYQHHERFDGSGYPRGLAGQTIDIGARIFAVADTFDALRFDRVYRPGVSAAEAAAEIRRGVGTQFDPEIVRVFLESLDALESVAARAAAPSATDRG